LSAIPYRDFGFPAAPPHRPYTIVDMVATIDGKIVSGERGDDVVDLGSTVDHAVLRALEDVVDGVLIGAGTLRASPPGWDPKTRFRVVMSKSGRVDSAHTFLQGPEAFVAGPADSGFEPTADVRRLTAADAADVGRQLRALGCGRLLVLGGSAINAAFLTADLVDEMFLTIAPKIKCGASVPTMAGGLPLPRESLLSFALLEHHAVGDELFLRYRREPRR